MKKNQEMKIKLILVVISMLLLGVFLGRIGLSQTGDALKSVVEPGSMTSEASYVIFTDGTDVYAKNGTTGEIEFQSTNASYVIQSALNALTPGRIWQEKIVLKGNFTLTAGIILPSYTILEIDGKLERGFNGGYMIDTDSSVQNQFINIVGGMIDGERATYSGSGIRLQASRWCRITDSWIYDHKTDAITLNATPGKENYNIWISRNQINSAEQYCLNLGISDIWVEDNYIECSVGEFAAYVNAGAVTLAHNHIMSGGLADCVYIVNAGMNNAIHGGEIENCRNGVTSLGSHTIIDGVLFHLNNRSAIYLPIGSESSTITGCSFYDNSRNIQGYSDIILENTVNNTITGNVFSTPTTNTRSAVREVGTSDYNIISGNTIDTANYYNPVIEKVGSHTVVKENSGYNLPQESVETASYIISTDGTNYYAKNGTTGFIDFSGTDASQVIQNAIGNLTNGGEIFIKVGTYNLTNTITLKGNVSLIGEGSESTIFNVQHDNDVISVIGNSSVPQEPLKIAGIYIQGNGHVGRAIYLYYASNVELTDIEVFHCNSTTNGVIDVEYSYIDTFDHVRVIGAAGYVSPAFYLKNMNDLIMRSSGDGFQYQGMYLWNDNSILIQNCNFEYNTNEGVYMDSNNGVITIDTCYFDGNTGGNGDVVVQSSATYPSSTINIINNRFYEPNKGVKVGYANAVRIEGNWFYNCSLWALELWQTLNDTWIVNNNFDSTAVLYAPNGGNYTFFENHGYITENSGTTIASNNVWIPHGLATTPTTVTITSMNATYSSEPVIVSWTNSNSTHFQVGVYWTNGTAITNNVIGVSWHAKV